MQMKFAYIQNERYKLSWTSACLFCSR